MSYERRKHGVEVFLHAGAKEMEKERRCRRDLSVREKKNRLSIAEILGPLSMEKTPHPNSQRGLRVKSVICLQLPGEPQASEWVLVVF